ncbi:MAG TPA: TolC family protein [Planctomycetaceae bacterium]|nr:TolC family protein [Planctomycetaceae bacterium]
MCARSSERILGFIAILAAALGGCQTAGTSPDSSRLPIGASLSTGAISAVRATSTPSPANADEAAPRIELALDSGDRSATASTTENDSAQKHLVADFTVATTVPAAPAASESRPAAPAGQSAADALPQTPLVASAPAAPAGPGTSADAGAVPLTLDAAIATSLDRNDTLVTLRAGEPVAQAMLDVAEHYPYNPYIKAEVLPYARDPFGNLLAVRNTVYILQSLELAHQQRYREASAAAALNQVRWNVVAAELTTLATTEKLFFTALYQRDLRDLAQRAASLNEELAADVERRFKSGLAKPGEDTTARVSVRQNRKQAALAEANYKLALVALERQLNIVGDRPFELVGRLEDFQWLPIDGMGSAPGEVQSSAQLAETLADERPDVRAAQAGTNVAQSNADLARANTVQNVQFGPYYERDEFETLFFGFAAQMNLPIWDSGKPLARQREAECTQKVIGLNALRMRARVEVQTALERYQRARNLAEKEHSNLVQSLSGDLARVKRQFDVGQADILNVFATQTSLLQEQKAYLDLLNELAQAAADVTLTAGLPPARVTSGPRTESPPPVPPAASSEKTAQDELTLTLSKP